jgi:hypothetical protein
MMLLAASLTISSDFDAIESSIQSAPHWEHTDAGTSLTTRTPNPKSTVKVVRPAFFLPPQRGHVFGDRFGFIYLISSRGHY